MFSDLKSIKTKVEDAVESVIRSVAVTKETVSNEAIKSVKSETAEQVKSKTITDVTGALTEEIQYGAESKLKSEEQE